MFIGKYNKSVILTYMGVGFALTGIHYLLNGRSDITMICLIIAGICDLFDGTVARKCKRDEEEKEFGIQIDSLSDVVSFLVFPMVVLIKFDNRMLPVAILFVLAGIIRLAYFNIHSESTPNYYKGVPVTTISLILPIYYLLAVHIEVLEGFYGLLYLIVAISFILNVKVKKPKGIWYIIFSLIAVIVTIGILLTA